MVNTIYIIKSLEALEKSIDAIFNCVARCVRRRPKDAEVGGTVVHKNVLKLTANMLNVNRFYNFNVLLIVKNVACRYDYMLNNCVRALAV